MHVKTTDLSKLFALFVCLERSSSSLRPEGKTDQQQVTNEPLSYLPRLSHAPPPLPHVRGSQRHQTGSRVLPVVHEA